MTRVEDIAGLSQLSNDVYSDNNRVGSPGYSQIDGAFEVNGNSGFQANTYFNSSTNTLVITYAGTDPIGGGDLDDGWELARGRVPEQAAEAVSYANRQIESFQLDGNTNFNIVYTGHSLGGYLAQHAHLTNGNGSAVAFNSPGVNSGTSGNGSPEILYVFSNPSEWDGASSIHTLGDYVGDDYIFVMGAEGHSVLELRDQLNSAGVETLTLDELRQRIIDEFNNAETDGDVTSVFDTWSQRGAVQEILLEAAEETGNACFGPEVPIDMWPLDPDLKPGPDGIYDQDEVRAKVWKKPIELIEVGDIVVSFDDNDNLVPGPVTRTFQNDAKILLDFHGTRVTPGHVYYRPDSKKSYKYETLIDVLRDDGVIKHQDGTLIRAATNVPVDSPRDGFVQAVTQMRKANGTVVQNDAGRIRLGTRFLVGTGKERKSWAVADLIEHGGGVVGDDELIRVGSGEPMPFLWDFGETLPKPEDFVLACSGTTLEDIYKAAEWESQGPRLPPPMVLDRGPVQPLKGVALSAMARNEPLDVVHSPITSAKPQRTLNRKQRKAMEAKQRKLGKSRRQIVV